jgi:cholesterol oxidase
MTPVAAAGSGAAAMARTEASAAAAVGDGSGTVSPAGPLKAAFRVTISTSDLTMLLVDPTHPATADGTVWVDGYTGAEGRPIVGGTFNLFTDADGLYRRKMLYSLPFHSDAGRRYNLQGYKEVWDHGHFDVWGSTTTLYATLVDADDHTRPAVARGVLRLNLPMFARQMSTLRVTGTGSLDGQLMGLSAFGRFFAVTLFDVFVRARLDA